MAGPSKIEWTEATWNPVTGCDKISPGCKNCYAERLALRLKAAGTRQYKDGFVLTLHPEALEIPLGWKKSKVIFVNSMSDLFHRDVPIEFIRRVFTVMRYTPQHQFQILTKRADRLAELDHELPWSDNVWMGVSVESGEYVWRIAHLKQTKARIKFLSLEPLLGPLPQLDLKGIDWVIVGESPVHMRDPWNRSGFVKYGPNAFQLRSLSFSSSGVGYSKVRLAGRSMVEHGTKCQG